MREFFADYGELVAPVAAIINGFIAVIAAQFFKENLRAKLILVTAAGVLGVSAVGASILNQRQILAIKNAQQEKTRQKRETLGTFIAEGLKLISDCSDSSTPPRWAAMNDWITRVKTFVRENMGESFEIRLGSTAGAPIDRVCRNADEAHNQLYKVVSIINFRLDQYISEVAR